MRTADRLQSLIDQGLIESVIRPLLSGKEADVYLVVSEGERRVAKVYKEAQHRSFKHRSTYTEGRRVRNTRQQRAMDKRSRFGRDELEAAWQNVEVDVIYKLHAAGVRVPVPYSFVDGVLVMELIADADGKPAPRLADMRLSPDQASALFPLLIRDVVRMLCAGVVHGDLSDFNILIADGQAVIIDFPQAVDPAANRNAKKLLLRDVHNLTQFLGRFNPRLRKGQHGREMWDLYERGKLLADTELTGKFHSASQSANVEAIMAEIQAAEREELRRREALGLPPRRPARQPVAMSAPPIVSPGKKGRPARQPVAMSAPPIESPGKMGRSKRKSPVPSPSDAVWDLDALLVVEPD